MLVMVLGNENPTLYAKHKQLYNLYQIPSQCVTVRKWFKVNLSIASNILK